MGIIGTGPTASRGSRSREMSMRPTTPRIAVWPPRERERLRALFDALERAFEVELVDPDAGREPLDGVVAFTSPGTDLPDRLTGVRTLAFHSGPAVAGINEGSVLLADSPELDSRLRGRTLPEGHARATSADLPAEGVALASQGRQLLWTRHTTDGAVVDRCCVSPVELCEGESLRDHFGSGRFLALLPLICLLREVRRRHGWKAPSLRASFTFDDPNLHTTSYGYVDYPRVASSASERNYHAVMAMVPLDAWFANKRATEIFRSRSSQLSLAIHGALHLKGELAEERSVEAVDKLLAGALRRIARFQRKTGVRVDPVMVPPHGLCSQSIVAGLLRHRFDAMSINRPFPWAALYGDSQYKHPPPWRPLTGFLPGEFSEGALPVILRQSFDGPPTDLVFRAFLDQPLVVFGHHDDLATGLDRLESAADFINGLGEVGWGPLAELASGSVESRRDGDVLDVRPFSRKVRVAVDPDVTEVRIHADWVTPADRVEVRAENALGAELDHAGGRVVCFRAGTRETPGELTIHVAADMARPVARVRGNELPPLGALLRRTLTESRDRLMPVVRPAPRGAAGASETGG